MGGNLGLGGPKKGDKFVTRISFEQTRQCLPPSFGGCQFLAESFFSERLPVKRLGATSNGNLQIFRTIYQILLRNDFWDMHHAALVLPLGGGEVGDRDQLATEPD